MASSLFPLHQKAVGLLAMFGSVLEILGIVRAYFLIEKSRMHGILNELYLRNFLEMDVIFRDESNNGN